MIPQPTDTTPNETCQEYLGQTGYCPRPARVADGPWMLCWPHRDERATWRETVWGSSS